MVKMYRYEFDPDLILHKLKSPLSFTSLIIDGKQPNNILLTNRLPRPLRQVNSLNHYISTPDHVWDPMGITYDNFITSYDERIVYQEERDGS